MTQSRLPNTDSIAKLAAFWDAHDLTEFEDQLREVTHPVFEREAVAVPLKTSEILAVERLAKTKGVTRELLIRSWVLQNLPRRNGASTRRRTARNKQ